ncbi:hypothetical protein NJL88_29445 [Streptomyces sp. DK15]|nr:hypothetical protein [Streptomyces sp. DK15]
MAARLPAYYVAFDLLQQDGTELLTLPQVERRRRLEVLFAARALTAPWTLCPMTTDIAKAREWLETWTDVSGVEGLVIRSRDITSFQSRGAGEEMQSQKVSRYGTIRAGPMTRSTVITQGVKITTVCEACGGMLIRDAGQFIDRGRLWWGTEGTCQTCPVAWCEEDSGGATPEAIRQALLTEHGPARLLLIEPEASRVTVLRVLREGHERSLAQARAMAEELRTTGLVGTLVEMELIAAQLRHRSVAVTVGSSPS